MKPLQLLTVSLHKFLGLNEDGIPIISDPEETENKGKAIYVRF